VTHNRVVPEEPTERDTTTNVRTTAHHRHTPVEVAGVLKLGVDELGESK
jgi:hypothetical protein